MEYPNLKICTECRGKCCRHVSLEIDKPTCKRDYDNIIWYLLHKNVFITVTTDNDWYIEFVTDCEKLTEESSCGIYHDRPKICREYPDEESYCEYMGEEKYYKIKFSSADEFKDYLRSRGIDWKFKFRTG